MISRPEDILGFWLGAPGAAPLANSARWYDKNPAFDREIKDRFGATFEAATSGKLAAWKETAQGRLALVIVLDQFSRNMFRDDPRAFAQDGLARDVTLEAIGLGDEGILSPIERSFLYMPLMHAEDVDLQHRCVAAFNRLVAEAPSDLRSYFENCVSFAKRHEEIIERFGRFPHRNALLGRTSTKEEELFLKRPGSSF